VLPEHAVHGRLTWQPMSDRTLQVLFRRVQAAGITPRRQLALYGT
jgi:hypothetical protein